MAKDNSKTGKRKDKVAPAAQSAAQGTDKQQAASKSKAAPKAERQATAAKSAEAKAGPGKVQQLKTFFEESKVELKKVTWPSRKETTATSIAVVVVAIVMAIYLGLMDFAWSSLVKLVLS